MNKNAYIIIIAAVVIGIGIIFLGGAKENNSNNNNSNTTTTNKISGNIAENTIIKDGVQYITINAKGGYSPRVSTAKAGIPTKLIVKTNNTYDCSLALRVPTANFQKILAKTGEEIIDLGTPTAGVPARGVCGMGMYSFLINFE